MLHSLKNVHYNYLFCISLSRVFRVQSVHVDPMASQVKTAKGDYPVKQVQEELLDQGCVPVTGMNVCAIIVSYMHTGIFWSIWSPWSTWCCRTQRNRRISWSRWRTRSIRFGWSGRKPRISRIARRTRSTRTSRTPRIHWSYRKREILD